MTDKPNTLLTVELLELHHASSILIDYVATQFPAKLGMEVTRETCVKHALYLDWDWLAHWLLGQAGSQAYWDATVLARRDRDRAVSTARRIFDEETTARSAKARRELRAADRDYTRATDAAWQVYQKALATVFADNVLRFGLEA